jgi:hypothetical protein
MMLTRRSVTVGSAAIATTAVVLGPDAAARSLRLRRSAEGGQAVLDWERIAIRTIYTDSSPVTPIPVGVPVLGFVSLAMHRAAQRSAHTSTSSESAAVARAAHDVLEHYYPYLAGRLDADLAATFAAIGPSPSRTKGSRTGAEAARDLIGSRQGDGYLDTSVHYAKTPGPGVWTPNPGATDMLGAWIGSLRPLFVAPVPVSGPYSLGSAAWAADFEEAKRYGGAAPTERTQAQTDTAHFFNVNAAAMMSHAVIRHVESHPLGILATARLFARIHAAMTDSLINCWMLKRDVGFWRPFQAIAGPYEDGNPATVQQPGWTPPPQFAMPNYSEYVSGHGCITGPLVEVVRRTLGETTPLELVSANFPGQNRTYARLTDLEADAFMARIWGGFHFRKAMVDAYDISHRTAERVMQELA